MAAVYLHVASRCADERGGRWHCCVLYTVQLYVQLYVNEVSSIALVYP